METGRVMQATWSCRPAIQRLISAMGDAAASDLLNRGDTHGVISARRLDSHHVADTVADQRLAHGRLEANASGLGVGFRRTDDAVGLFVLAVLGKADGAAHAHLAPLHGSFDEDVVLDDRLELAYPSLHHALLVLGRVVFEVLGKVPQLTRR